VDEGYLIHIRKSKTDQTGQGHVVPIFGEASIALTEWLIKSGNRTGYLFRGIKPDNTFNGKMSGGTINRMIKKRIHLIGLDPAEYGAHSLRSGFITAATRSGLHLKDAMALSGHVDSQMTLKYYRALDIINNPGAKLV